MASLIGGLAAWPSVAGGRNRCKLQPGQSGSVWLVVVGWSCWVVVMLGGHAVWLVVVGASVCWVVMLGGGGGGGWW